MKPRSIRSAVAGAGLLAACCAAAAPQIHASQPVFAGKGPVGRDNGQSHACTGVLPGTTAVLCVRADATPGGNGTAAAPFASINGAIAAAKAGDVVQVAVGTYAENVALGSVNNWTSRNLTLLGGFAADFQSRDAGQFVVTIDAGGTAPGVQLHVDSAQPTVLDGFRITNGHGLGADWSNGGGGGAGVYAAQEGNGEIVISHNEIFGNATNNYTVDDSRGGGIHTHARNWGGATPTMRIEDNRIYDNVAGKGAGIHAGGRHVVVLRNVVDNNIAHSDHGGGIYLSAESTVFRDNVVSRNEIGATIGYGWGGGIILVGNDVEMAGNVFTDNYAPGPGSGVFWDEGATGTMRNDLLYRNRCPADNSIPFGAALYIDGGPGGASIVDIEHITVVGHVCSDGWEDGAAVFLQDEGFGAFRNSIFWGNSGDFDVSKGSFTVAWSLTDEPGEGNFHADPLFADVANGDFHLRSAGGRWTADGWVIDGVTSPAIDAGDPAADYSEEGEPNGGRVNLGAYGNTAQASRTPDGTVLDRIFADGFETGGDSPAY